MSGMTQRRVAEPSRQTVVASRWAGVQCSVQCSKKLLHRLYLCVNVRGSEGGL